MKKIGLALLLVGLMFFTGHAQPRAWASTPLAGTAPEQKTEHSLNSKPATHKKKLTPEEKLLQQETIYINRNMQRYYDKKKWYELLHVQEVKNAHRYIMFAEDNQFYYYLDRLSTKWIYAPGNNKEKIISAWIILLPKSSVDSKPQLGDYMMVNADSSYLLDHYYINPATNQIQFVTELDVYGQPQNTANQGRYSMRNWESIVPGSVEDTIFIGINAIADLLPDSARLAKANGLDRQVSNFLDRCLNISI